MRTLLVLFLVASSALGRGLPCEDMLTGCKGMLGDCDNALSACKDLTDAQSTQILHLKQDVHDLEEAVVDAQNREPALPWYVYVLIGAAGAITAGKVFK